jgi:aminoglycoside phosphotransferase (APT) family kinase protein
MAPQLGAFLAALHRIAPPEAAAMGAGSPDLGRLRAVETGERVRQWAAQANERGVLSDMEAVVRTIDALTPDALDLERPVLVHGDLNFRNILVSDVGLASVIDWVDCQVSHAAVDLGLAAGFLPAASQDAFRLSYGPIDEDTWRLAHLFALHLNLIILVSAHDTGRPAEVREAQWELHNILDTAQDD